MQTSTVKQYSVSLTSWFAEAVSLGEAGLATVARKSLLRFGGYGLRPLDVFQREGDRLFDYDLSFSLFNRTGSFRLTSEGVHVAFQNARDDKDAGIIADCLTGILECLTERRIREHRLEAYLHATLPAAAERDLFLASLGSSDRKLPLGGCVLYFPPEDPFGETRLLVDRSVLSADAVFLNWTVQFSHTINLELLTKVSAQFRRLAESVGLNFGNT